MLKQVINPDIRKIKKVFFLSILFILFFCKNINKDYKLKSNETSDFYVFKKYNSKMKIFLFSSNNKIKDSIVFYKKGSGFFEKSYSPFDKEDLLILQNKKDTFYKYRALETDFYCKIVKLNKKNFKSTCGNIDSTRFKYRFSIYYKNDFNVYRIESILGKKTENYYIQN